MIQLFFKEWLALGHKKQVNWKKPDLDVVIGKLHKVSKNLNIPEEELVSAFRRGRLIDLKKSVWKSMNNTESNHPGLSWDYIDKTSMKSKTFIDDIKSNNTVSAPVVLEVNGQHYLVSGDTKLSICRLFSVTPKVWHISL